MSRILAAIFAMISLLTWADQPRHRSAFVSENGRFVLLSIHGASNRLPSFEKGRFKEYVRMGTGEEEIWGVFDGNQAEVLEDLPGFAITFEPLYSLRGTFGPRTVFVSNDGKALTVVDDYSARAPSEALEVLHFYYEGRLKRAYSLSELLDDIRNITPTASHFFWLRRQSLRFDDKLLHLKTTECRRLSFEARTGEILTESRVDDDARCEEP